MPRHMSFQYFGTISFVLLSALQCATLTKATPLETNTLNSRSIEAPKSTCNGSGTVSATDSAVFTSEFVKNQSLPLSWVLGVVAHPYDRETVEVSRSFYFGPQMNGTSNSSATVQGCALFFPSASQHHNTSNTHQDPTDANLPAKCLADMKQLVQKAARNSSAQFETDPSGTCGQIAGELVITHLESCFGYDITNVHPRPLSGLGKSSNNTDDYICHPSTTPKYNLTLVEDNSLIDQKDSFGLVSMISYSTPIITIIYPSPMPSNITTFDADVHYTVLKPVNYQSLLDLTQSSLASAFGISKVLLIGTLIQTAFMFL